MYWGDWSVRAPQRPLKECVVSLLPYHFGRPLRPLWPQAALQATLRFFCEMDYDRFSKEQHEGADVGSFAPVLVEEGRWELAGAGLDCRC